MISFDKSELHRQLDKSLRRNLPVFVQYLKVYMRVWIEDNIDFKNATVRMANGTVTSDLKRAEVFLKSVGYNYYDKWISNSVYYLALNHMNAFDEDYIGWYYEYGTGTLEDLGHVDYTELEDKNPYRTGKKIVTRSIKVAGGLWRDAGGMLRKTTSRVGGLHTDIFMRVIGGETKAYHWSVKALEYAMSKVSSREIERLLKDVDMSKCIKLDKKITLGG